MSKYIDVAINCLRDEAGAVLHLIDNINADFDKAVELILHCSGKLIVTGVGKSGHIGAKIAATLSSTGTPSFFVNPLDVFHGDLGVITKEDVVLALSNSGQTDELLRFLPYLLEQKIPVIGMTGNPKSPLAQNSTVHLNAAVAKEAGPLGLAPTSSTTAALAMGDALACALMDARDFKASDFAQFHPGGTLGRRLLTKAKDIMRTEDLPVISPTMTLGEAVIHVSNGRLGLCVAQEEGKIVGIITDGDIRRAIQASRDNFFQTTVAEVMTRTPKTVSPEAKVSEIESILNTNKIHCVLVTAPDGRLLGIVDSFRTAL
ncbi:KpsF/GutQ family sugar-phosphate isomerase [Alloprevotella tannerae]|jgi:sugar isomerase, kpsF/gutQ family|uniref:KpsF/GutQ family sugar-phosphate isomerase n=1 Tax=Alloprevotella tannerae TaxID=76122 RepID=UPI001EDA193E|nr:KpsF/GutQ family sugar-phosphate isomerase [Alloprevotella tannerae]MCG2648203.1 KpsF/GutQ family sugar-phosphate isomerase [Alloprevotella tannerae]